MHSARPCCSLPLFSDLKCTRLTAVASTAMCASPVAWFSRSMAEAGRAPRCTDSDDAAAPPLPDAAVPDMAVGRGGGERRGRAAAEQSRAETEASCDWRTCTSQAAHSRGERVQAAGSSTQRWARPVPATVTALTVGRDRLARSLLLLRSVAAACLTLDALHACWSCRSPSN